MNMFTLLVTWAKEKRTKILQCKVHADRWSSLLIRDVMSKHSNNLKVCY